VAIVYFTGDLTRYTGGLEIVAVDAPRVIELRRALADRFPGVGERLARLAVAIDGTIHLNADYLTLEPGTEVHFVPPVAGG
jgi:molybdopterin converting factor small subunit